MKKVLLWLLGAIGLAGLTFGGSLCVMASVHDNSVKDEFFNWFPSLEQTVETEEEKTDDEIIVEDENGEETTEEEQTPSEENGEQTETTVEDQTE